MRRRAVRRKAVRRTATRLVAGPWAVWGAVMLVHPSGVTRLVCGGGPEPRAWIVRLLGARLVAQHGFTLLHPTRDVVLAGAGVDVLHAASMGLVRARWPRYARPAWVSGSTSAASALAGVLAAPQAQR